MRTLRASMSSGAPSGYPSFRLKVVLNTAVFVFVSVIAQHALMELADGFAYQTIDVTALLDHFARLLARVVVPSVVVGSILVGSFMSPLEKVLRQMHAGEHPAERSYEQALRTLVVFPYLLVALNVIIFTVGYIVAAPSNRIATPRGVVLLLQNVACAMVCAYVQITVNNLILARPRSLLRIHFLGKLREAGSGQRNMLIMVSLALYVMFMIIGVSQSINNSTRLYAAVYESVVKEHMSVEQATAAYRTEVASILQLPPGKVALPSARRAAGETGVDIVYVGISVFLLALAVFIQLIASRSQGEQLAAVTTKLRDIAKGRGDLTERLLITQFDEIGGLCDAINSLLDKLRDLLAQFVQAGERVMHSSTTLRGVLGNTAATTEQMVASIAQISSNVASQAEVAAETENALTTMLDSLDRISANVDAQASSVEQTSSAMAQMAANNKAVTRTTIKANEVTASLARAAREGELAVGNATRSVRDLERSSDQVSAIVTVIAKIAAQTNLLAMNAAIEAAHAGESGRGFAVVAEEVRNLAETSSTSAKEIAVHIKEMSALMKSVVKLSEDAGQALQGISHDMDGTTVLMNQIAGAMREQDSGATEIVSAMASLVASTQEIRRIAEEQKNDNASIRRSIETLVRIFTEIRAATEEQTRGNREIAEGMSELQDVASSNQKVVDDLQALLGGFVLTNEGRSPATSAPGLTG